MIPARMCLESLDRRPGIREQPGSIASVRPIAGYFRSSPNNGHGEAGPPRSEKCQQKKSAFLNLTQTGERCDLPSS
jgi:hypothetical protein